MIAKGNANKYTIDAKDLKFQVKYIYYDTQMHA